MNQRPRVALLSNPRSTGNIAQLPRIREFCAEHPDLFHYEVEHAHQIGEAMQTILRVKPCLLVINGGDGTVQAALTELHNGGHFDGVPPPPVAVLPSGKTNLIAMDLGINGDPVKALERLLDLARSDLGPHLVARELIALRSGGSDLPVIGMFLGGAGLADIMLYCRNRIYPLGLPNSLSHIITAVAVVLRQVVGLKSKFLPPEPQQLSISVRQGAAITGKFALMAVTTLEKLLLSGEMGQHHKGTLKFVAVEQRPASLVRVFVASLAGKLGRTKLAGVHIEEAEEISIEGDKSQVILDGETFSAEIGFPITLRPAMPLSFVRLAA